MSNTSHLEKRIRLLLGLFIVCLILSGITAFFLEWELRLLSRYQAMFPAFMRYWLNKAGEGVIETGRYYPYMAYGTDWLAFGHIIIACFFYAPLKDPLRYVLVIDIGMLSCLLVFPLAFICGPLRGIPLFWRLIDCSFGAGGLLLLGLVRKNIAFLGQSHNINTVNKIR